MRDWDVECVARAAGAIVASSPSRGDGAAAASAPSGAAEAGPLAQPGRAAEFPGPLSVGIDSRDVAAGELFVGLPGERTDGGSHAAQALRGGAWGVLVAPEHAQAALGARAGATVLTHDDPLAGLHGLARAWRAELGERGAKVVAITGSTGKTSTKDILAALLGAHMRTVATPANLNTEIGLPLALLAAPADTEALVLEMAMRGRGQIAQLTEIARPDVGVIVNVGPAHLELLGSLEAIAAAKAELIAGIAPGASVVVPADEPLLDPHARGDVHTVTFGEGGEVSLLEQGSDGTVVIAAGEERVTLRPSFRQAHNLLNLLAAVAAARALGVAAGGELDVSFSAMRGQRSELAGGTVLIDDCYNANPMSMRAAIDDLAETAPGRRVAVLGDMLELGPDAPRLHRELGEHASARGVELLIAVGPLAAETAGAFAGESHAAPDANAAAKLTADLLRAGDTVLVKASRGVGLERVADALRGRR
ncbi:MAG TPA: UDP-N-acetylmuramoyl-tripeptide--D-alanyl-D-alanine ligase [Solirubrobacteraceae bacterium]|nr:UDP-N-acetylmuramoyl-tripeptide--D-alanyl-D-alanine ligase [Solirubrobacteraceae bacterium]